MDKNKSRKPKTIPIKYPAPYSHSWASPEPEKKADKVKKKIKKNSALIQQNVYPGCCRRTKPKLLHGSDPYAPHLKYGIFPPQNQKIRNPLTKDNIQPSSRRTADENISSNLANNKRESLKTQRGQSANAPLFIIRPIDKRHRSQLSMSETLHLDIKPRRFPIRSPIRKKSPLFKNAIPKMNSNLEYVL